MAPTTEALTAYVVNLDAAGDRWRALEAVFSSHRLRLVRISGVDGSGLELPLPGYSEELYHHRHGRTTNLREVGCYLSHLRAWVAFLQTEEKHALICEDDITVGGDLVQVLHEVIRHTDKWDLVRLSGLREGRGVPAIALSEGRSLCVNFGRLKGTGAYLISRRAAEGLGRSLQPMWLPFDHALDREWCNGLRALSVRPFPISQTDSGFRTSVQRGPVRKLGRFRRWSSTYPYQIFNEISRWVFRAKLWLGIRLRRPFAR